MEPIRVLHNIVLMDAGGIETLVMNLYRHGEGLFWERK